MAEEEEKGQKPRKEEEGWVGGSWVLEGSERGRESERKGEVEARRAGLAFNLPFCSWIIDRRSR